MGNRRDSAGRPDLMIAGLMASLFLKSATKIPIQSSGELRHAAEHG